jgi:hypothetical protein
MFGWNSSGLTSKGLAFEVLIIEEFPEINKSEYIFVN